MKTQQRRRRAIEAVLILNGLIEDLVGATTAFQYLETDKRRGPQNENLFLIYERMADSFLFVALAKWIEFYDHYKSLIPKDLKEQCKKLRKELDARGVREFRHQVVAHFWSEKYGRPLRAKEIQELENKITKGDSNQFLAWVNDPEKNHLGSTVVGTSEFIRAALQKDWSLSARELSEGNL